MDLSPQIEWNVMRRSSTAQTIGARRSFGTGKPERSFSTRPNHLLSTSVPAIAGAPAITYFVPSRSAERVWTSWLLVVPIGGLVVLRNSLLIYFVRSRGLNFEVRRCVRRKSSASLSIVEESWQLTPP